MGQNSTVKREDSFSLETIEHRVSKLIDSGFWGSVTLQFQGGKIVLMSVTETIKPSREL